MNVRPIDKSKRSNRRCINCEAWPGYTDAQRHFEGQGRSPYCERAKRECEYWHCCKQFSWNPEKTYL